MSRQKAEDGAYALIAIASLALAFFFTFIARSSAQEPQQAAYDGANKPYYEFVYTYPRLPAECKRADGAHSLACEKIRNAEPEIAMRLHAPDANFALLNFPVL